MAEENANLEKKLGPWMLWGLGVGYVISGMYFGWNLGLEKGGTYGMAIATFFVIIMYITFTFSYAELAVSIPKAGGAFDYARLAFGERLGFVAGFSQAIEFVFAPPAIAYAIGAYIHTFLPSVSVLSIAIVVYFLFTALNIYGVKTAASFELVITIFAVIELLVFAFVCLPEFEMSNLQKNPLPHGYSGVFAALPFAIWFFLAIEGVANVAEETINPQKNILIGFGSAIASLVFLAILTFIAAVGVSGWEDIVFEKPGSLPSDSPLPLALGKVVGKSHFLYHMLVSIGLFGLLASFHGIILAAGRATYELGKENFAPPFLGLIHSRFHTPARALLVNMIFGILALFTGKTAEIITLACFGALSLYITSCLSLLQLRKQKPELERPFQVPFYPYFPFIALSIAIVSLLAMVYYNVFLFIIYLMIHLFFYSLYRYFSTRKANENT